MSENIIHTESHSIQRQVVAGQDDDILNRRRRASGTEISLSVSVTLVFVFGKQYSGGWQKLDPIIGNIGSLPVQSNIFINVRV
ncbi:MAG TPA: hypothetical protein VGI44_05410 [Acidimicrobiales bacterium]